MMAESRCLGGGRRVDGLAELATGRVSSLFGPDVDNRRDELCEAIEGSRILVIGGAGSIGGATARTLLPFHPRVLHILDQNENTLVELVRDLRSSFDAPELPDLGTLPLNFGGPVTRRLLLEEEPYDYVLNFAALKHVRSEKNGWSVLQMLDTNVLKPVKLLGWLAERGGVRRYFSVSTDKAANPVNLMGASKRLMEHVIFSDELVERGGIQVSSARFANVAFSDGSLLHGWLQRLAKCQPLAVPRDTRRYFVSIEEAGQICLLAAFLAPNHHVLVPRLDPTRDLSSLSDIAVKVLNRFGLEPCLFEDESAAKHAAIAERNGGYPLLLTPLDTSGEKPFEEFVSRGESTVDVGLVQLHGVPHVAPQAGRLLPLLEWIEERINSPEKPVTRDEIVREIQKVVPEFEHRSSRKMLDERL